MRIDKLLANSGFGSRREVKELLKRKVVFVDEQVVINPKVHVDTATQVVRVEDEVVTYEPFVYVMLNKPQNVVSATSDELDATVVDLLDPYFASREVFPVGRLDKDTEGLVLLTNNGKLAHKLLTPKSHVMKEYIATIDQPVTEDDIAAFAAGVTLDDGYLTKPAILSIPNTEQATEIVVCISEGKFHQIKRMFEAVGKKVVYLKRTKIGSLDLDESLELGQSRRLTNDELEALLADTE
ncbi:pseudouridine synthase [Culicoidibacter larvae]|uniref:Pseudouridine synthase n=1 Tax=Culicoidibacter larvae TaxID=2579976 RepID=A0A5R8QF92_9FIRM|nr:pseudouridine synthase [Culicoidibacter larvae]TLG76658.1 rRNA pseudouridine synthase [Culicoidibacter larvae]